VARSIFYYTDSRLLGGAEQALLMLIEALDRTEWEPVLLLEAGPGVEAVSEPARALGVPVHLVPPLPLGLAGARRVPGFTRLLRSERPDVFHAHLSWPLAAKYGLVSALLARVPAVVATVQLIPEMELDRSSRLQLRAIARRTGCSIAVSRDIAAELVTRFGWPAERIEVVHNAVDLDRFRAAEAPRLRTELTGGEDRPVVLTAARLDEQKGHPVLFRAAAELPEALFVLAGEGPRRAALQELAAELGIADRVLFLGHRTDIPELLAASDVFALPSLYEGSSLAVLEAMAAGRAVVSSAIGGTDELLTDGEDGLLVAPGDSPALAAALRRLLGDGELRAELGRAARARAERDFSRGAMEGRVTAIYRRLLGGGPAG
jgi:glycosyltransferase involved in cell wall biosynthesis